jgi:hypothetical protein
MDAEKTGAFDPTDDFGAKLIKHILGQANADVKRLSRALYLKKNVLISTRGSALETFCIHQFFD